MSTTGRVPAAAPEVEGGKRDATAGDGGVQPNVLPLIIASGLILFGPRVYSAPFTADERQYCRPAATVPDSQQQARVLSAAVT